MNLPALRRSVLAISLVAVLLSASCSTSALDRNEGDYWVYSMVLVVPGFGVEATGTLKYEFFAHGVVDIGDVMVPANIMRVTGSAGGSIELIDLSAELVFEGFVYETREGMSIVKSYLISWTNITWGSGDFAWPMNFANMSVSTYAPPLLSGFDPGNTLPGATWTETIEVRTLVYNMTLGEIESDEIDQTAISFTAHAQLETVSTEAGEFESLRITATDEGGSRIVFWWSDEIDLFVKAEAFVPDDSEPVVTLALEDCSGITRTNVLLFVAIGGAATAIALVALAVVILKRRPPKKKTYGPSSVELLPPPP